MNTALHHVQSERAPDVEAKNAKGASIQQLTAAALADSSGAESEEGSGAKQAKRARHTYDQTYAIAAEASRDEEVEWQARLQEESGAELHGGDEDWDR